MNGTPKPSPKPSPKRCPLREDWRTWGADKRSDRLFMSCPGCGVYGSHVADLHAPVEVACSECGRAIGELEVFPGGRCVNCHGRHWRPSAEDFDNMTRAWQGKRPRNGRGRR